MKISKPSAPTMHEYLLYYGEEWVKKHFEMTGNQIDDLLYGSKLPTESQQKRVLDRARKEDDDKKAYMLENFRKDHFIWDEPNNKHIKCQNALEEELPQWSYYFLKKWTELYEGLLMNDMSYNGNGMKAHGWQHGERVLNKTTSKTTDDCIHDYMIRALLNPKMLMESSATFFIDKDSSKDKNGHNYSDENFLENVHSVDIDALKSSFQNNKCKNIDLS